MYKLVIPNKEVLEVFVLQIREWFDRVVANDQASTKKINCGFLEGKVEDIEHELTMFLSLIHIFLLLPRQVSVQNSSPQAPTL